MVIAALALLAILVCTPGAFAWGAATHVQLASDLMQQLWILPASVAGLLSRHAWSYFYGNVAADVVLAKKLSRIKQICHHWSTGLSILQNAQTDEDRAFGYGYLSHLAADTVAHNKFLPHQFAISRTTLNFGHLYWEMRADSHVDPVAWQRLRSTLRRTYPGAHLLLEHHLQDTLLSFRNNQRVFNRLNMVASMNSWRRSVEFWARLSRWSLPDDRLAQYRAESLDRIVDVLTRGRASTVLHDDPNGNAALGYARVQRRQLRQMIRAGMPVDHIVSEAAAVHAPRGTGILHVTPREATNRT